MDDGDCVQKQVSRYKWRLHLWGACVIGDASTITHCCVCFHSCKYLRPSVASLVFNCNETRSKSNVSFTRRFDWEFSCPRQQSLCWGGKKRESLQFDIAIPLRVRHLRPFPSCHKSSYFHLKKKNERRKFIISMFKTSKSKKTQEYRTPTQTFRRPSPRGTSPSEYHQTDHRVDTERGYCCVQGGGSSAEQ